MSCHQKRIINVRTPIVVYDQILNEIDIPHIEKNYESLEIGKKNKRVGKDRRKKFKSVSELSESSENYQKKIKINTKNIKKTAFIRRSMITLEGIPKNDEKLSTYQQIINKITSRHNLFKKDLQKNERIQRKYSNDFQSKLKSSSPLLFKSFECSCNNFSVMSLPKRKRNFISDYSRKIIFC